MQFFHYSSSGQEITNELIGDLAYKSGYIFSGRIVIRDSSLFNVQPNKDYAIVQVIHFYRVSEDHRYIEGNQLTVKFIHPDLMDKIKNDSVIFFTSGFHSGKTLGVIENGILDWKDYDASFPEKLVKIFHEAFKRDQRNYLKDADMIFRGMVIEIVPATEKEKIIEKGFNWATAKIKVIKKIEGEVQEGQIIMADFAKERNTSYFLSPYLRPDDEGIFIISKKESIQWKRENAVLIHPLDFFMLKEEMNIINLLNETKN